jgi:predicted RNase H-like nuclease (RuvC/YqgF family)
MTRSLQRNEEIIKKLQYDKQSSSNEMANMREFSVTMESKTEQIVRQLTATDMENDHLQSVIGDLKLEIDMLRTQVNNEKSMIQSLEEIIASLREKDFQMQVDGQQRDSSISLANERVNQCDHKM